MKKVLFVLIGLLLVSGAAAWQQQSTRILIGQIRLSFNSNEFRVVTDTQSGETTISLMPRPKWQPPVPRELNCAGTICTIVSDPLPTEVELFRNGLFMAVGRDYTRSADRRTITLTRPAELHEVFFARYWYE